MIFASVLILQIAVAPPPAPPDSGAPLPPVSLAPTLDNTAGGLATLEATSPAVDSVRRRPRAIEYSDMYYTRLTIHKIGSYVMLPLFVGEYFTGDHLYKNPGTGGSTKGVHGAIAASMGVIFAVNTVTGVWNLAESRKDPAGRARRTVHGLIMLAADAGFLATAASAPGDDGDLSSRNRHRTLAITSGSLALVGDLMMYIWKN